MLQEVSVCSSAILTALCAHCAWVPCHRVGAGGLLWGHPARPHSGHSTGNREVPPCLMWGLQEEGKSEVIKKVSLL